MAEYLSVAEQDVNLNDVVTFTNSIPCTKGYIFHEDGTGVFTFRGITNNCFARYQVTFNGNIAIPTGGTAGPIAVSLSVDGEQRPSSKAIVTPAAVDEYNNVTSTAIITVPRACCKTVSVRAVSGVTDPADTPAPTISVANANLTVSRIA